MFGTFRLNELPICTLPDKTVKFSTDNFCTEHDGFTVCCEGYVLNSADDLAADIINTYKTDVNSLFTKYKGSFAAAVINSNGEYVVFNDLLSKKSLYYYASDDLFAFSTSFWELYDYLKAQGIKLTLNEAAFRLMLNQGVMIEDITYISEIKCLMPFQSIINGRIIELPFPAANNNVSAEDAAAELDRLFIEGCRLQFAKNEAAGYRQVCSLSGGMDSKAVILTAERLGYKPDICFTYAESGSDDERISRSIAADLGCEHIFYPMDGGGFLADRSCRIEGNEGMIAYSGTTGLAEVIKQLDCTQIGIVSSGIGGGEIMGDVNMQLPNAAESRNYLTRVVQLLHMQNTHEESELIKRLHKRYEDCNQFTNLREMRVCVNFARTAGEHFEVASPFLYEDFFCYALSLPAAMRTNRKLYRLWYEKYMPNSYETTFRPNDSADVTLTIFRRLIRKIKFTYRKISSKLSSKPVTKTAREMNPYDYWWATNEQLRSELNAMYKADMSTLGNIEPWLEKALNEAYEGSLPLKLRVLTATWVLNRMN